MKIRQGVALSVAVAAGLTLTACTGAPAAQGGGGGKVDGPITFQTWSLKNDTFTPYFTDLIAAFEDENPGTDVTWVDQPADGYEDKILQQAESGELPDVINLPPDMAFNIQKAGLLLDLKKADSSALDVYVPGGLDAYTYDGDDGVYGYPWYLGTELNYWNVDQFESAGLSKSDIPESLTDLFDIAETAAKADERVPMISDVPSPKGLLAATAEADSQSSIFVDGEFVFNTPEAAKIVDRYHELYELGAVTPEALQGAGTSNTNANSFNKGTVGWTTGGPNYIQDDISVNAPNLVDSVAVSPAFGNAPLFVQGVSVPTSTTNQATALAFAQFLTNNENQSEFVKLAVGFFPGTAEGNEDPTSFATDSEFAAQNTATELAAAQMSTAQVPNPPQYTNNMDEYAKQQIALAVLPMDVVYAVDG